MAENIIQKISEIIPVGQHNIGPSVEMLHNTVQNRLISIFTQGRSNDTEMEVYDISSSPDRTKDDPKIFYYFIEGRVRNFSINERTISGRFKTKIRWSKKENALTYFEDINIYHGDKLSDHKRDSDVKDYIDNQYNHPLDISIKNERLEIYPDNIYSYVSAIINKNMILFLRVIFERNFPEEKIFNDGIKTYETNWYIKRAETLFSHTFPDDKNIIKDTKEKLFGIIADKFQQSKKYEKLLRNSSAIKIINYLELADATNGKIKLKIRFEYVLDYTGFVGSYKSYMAEAFVYYQFNFEKDNWEFISIELDGDLKERK